LRGEGCEQQQERCAPGGCESDFHGRAFLKIWFLTLGKNTDGAIV
jgi:hypothetical protein